MFPPLDPTLAADLAELTPEQLVEAAVYARKLRAENKSAATKPTGTLGDQLLRFAGVLSNEEAAKMMQDIEEGCGQVDYAQWRKAAGYVDCRGAL